MPQPVHCTGSTFAWQLSDLARVLEGSQGHRMRKNCPDINRSRPVRATNYQKLSRLKKSELFGPRSKFRKSGTFFLFLRIMLALNIRFARSDYKLTTNTGTLYHTYPNHRAYGDKKVETFAYDGKFRRTRVHGGEGVFKPLTRRDFFRVVFMLF